MKICTEYLVKHKDVQKLIHFLEYLTVLRHFHTKIGLINTNLSTNLTHFAWIISFAI